MATLLSDAVSSKNSEPLLIFTYTVLFAPLSVGGGKAEGRGGLTDGGSLAAVRYKCSKRDQATPLDHGNTTVPVISDAQFCQA
jgi:hypothetical protein